MELRPLKLIPFTTNEIKPCGWLKKQLLIQANGLSGNLDKIWPDIRDSKWIGGDQEGWERVPYWLDGFIPLAYLIDDKDMQQRAKYYIDAILERQRTDGWICPCEDSERNTYDIWAAFLIGKVLVGYFDCTKDMRVQDAVYKMLRSIDAHIEHNTIFNWAATRWYECLIPIYWMYQYRPEQWLLELALKLAGEGTDFKRLYRTLNYDKRPEKHYWDFINHVVNQAMGLKSEALLSRITGECPNEFAHEMLDVLFTKHGTVFDHFTGDECLSGTSPTQGTELCGVVEAMYSYEHLITLTGDNFWADRLERLTYNALPATISPDMWTHQYDQMTNQVECLRIPEEEVHFSSNSGESHLFGLEPNFGCCTANFNQGWPKFCLSAFMKTDGGVAVTVLAPAILNTEIKGTTVCCKIITDYPFKDVVSIWVETDKPVCFDMSIRVPGFAKAAQIDGKDVQVGEFYIISKEWIGSTEIILQLHFETELVSRPNLLKAIRRGPLVYSVQIQEDWQEVKGGDTVTQDLKSSEPVKKSVERMAPYCDFEIRALSPWNYAYTSMPFERQEHDIGDVPFSAVEPPITLKTRAARIPWSSKHGVCAAIPDSHTPIGPEEQIVLVPYGCTRIRITEIPFTEVNADE